MRQDWILEYPAFRHLLVLGLGGSNYKPSEAVEGSLLKQTVMMESTYTAFPFPLHVLGFSFLLSWLAEII
jgi:hypothetical protein